MLRIIFSKKKTSERGPAIFLDRDGVINRRRPDDYVLDWSQFIFVDGIRAALKRLASLQLPMIVISNQACVGKGLLIPARLEEITRRVQEDLLSDGTPLAAAYYCIHHADEDCACRKPKPGLLMQATEDFHVDLARSVFIGDSVSDIQAAQPAGCAPLLFGSDLGSSLDLRPDTRRSAAAVTVRELFNAVAKCFQAAERNYLLR